MTVTSTLSVTTILAHLTAVAFRDIRDMARNVLVRDQNSILLAFAIGCALFTKSANQALKYIYSCTDKD